MNQCNLCDQPANARGWCMKHYLRWYRHGDPTTILLRKDLTPYERVMARTTADGDCLIFTGAKFAKGYGMVRVGGRNRTAHQIVWEHHHGPVPTRLELLHSCDNPPCVTVEHLTTGTHAQNMADAAARGRMHGTPVHSDAVVDEAITRVRAGEGVRAVGRDLGVSHGQVSKWVHGTSRPRR